MTPGRLQQETRKRRPFELAEQEVVLNVLRSNELFQHRFKRLFRQYGLTQPQYNILRILRGEGRPLPCLEIAERLIAVVPAITRLIDRLEAAGLVRKSQCDDDRRVWLVEITRRGRTLLARLDQPMHDTYRELCGHLSRAECAQLIRLLEKARSRVAVPA